MLRSVTLLLCLSLTVSGCGRLAGSNWNPLNWFGGSGPTNVAADGTIRPLIPEGQTVELQDNRVAIDQIVAVEIARTASGAIVRATGLASTQGYFNAELVLISAGSGTLTYEFRVEAPAGFEAVGSDASRRITVARDLDNTALRGVRRIVVQGARNSRSANR